MKRNLAVIAMLGALAACGGPTLPFDVGVKDFATDVLLGAPPADLPPTPIARPPLEAFGSVVHTTVVEVIDAIGTTTTTLPPCPVADPLANPELEVPRQAAVGGPESGSYPWRAQGETTFDGKTFPVTGTGTWTLANIVTDAESGFTTFDLVEEAADTRETSSYRIVPEDGVAPDPLRGEVVQEPGLYLMKQVIEEHGETAVYEWSPPVLMLPLPVAEDSEWDVNSVSGDGTVITFHGRIGELGDEAQEPGVDPNDPDIVDLGVAPTKNARVRVDACGRWIQGWNVRLEEGVLQSPTSATDLTFTESWAFGTQYGAMPLAMSRISEGTVLGAAIKTSRSITINAEPKVAGP